MNQDKVIKKLQLLKSIQPQHNVLNTIKKDVYMQIYISSNNNKNILNAYYFYSIFSRLKLQQDLSYRVAILVIFLIFIFTFSPFLQNKIHTISTYSRIAFTQNQYKKANIALADSQYIYADSKAINYDTSKDILQSLSLTNKELSLLKLKGEKGKYTAQQCHALYQNYLLYLEKMISNISGNQKSTLVLKSQILSYEEQAEKKLHMYRDL